MERGVQQIVKNPSPAPQPWLATKLRVCQIERGALFRAIAGSMGGSSDTESPA